MVAWPSGLRRWIKAPVSPEAWVRIPPLPDLHFFTSVSLHYFDSVTDNLMEDYSRGISGRR